MKKYLILLSVIVIVSLVFTSCDTLDPNAPQACFVTPDEVIAGLPSIFNSSCSVNATSFSWSFGDGGTSTEANPTYTFTDEGSYTVTLTVSNDAGKTDDQSTTVTVIAPSVIEHTGNIESDETWISGTHLVTGDVYVDGAILTIEAGAIVMFEEGTGIYLGYHSGHSGATMIANGTAMLPITFTSAAAIKSPGDWHYIGFYDGASNSSSMQFCVVEYGGGYSENYGELYIDGSSVALDNSTIRYSGAVGISVHDEGFFQSCSGNSISDNESYPIRIYGNYAHTIGANNNIVTTTGILVMGDKIEMDEVSWQDQTCAYVTNGDLYIGSETGSNLILDPGVEIRMGEGAGIYIGYYSNTYGTLTAEGTDGNPIKISSAAPDVAKSAGDWDYIGFYDGAGTSSSFDYCDIEYGGGYSDNYGMIYVDGSSISLTNSSISSSAAQGLALTDDAWFEACSDNTFGDNEDVPIQIYGNYAHTIGTGNDFTERGILVKGDRVEQASVSWLKHNAPYIVSGDVHIGVETGATLTIEPGTTVSFAEGAAIYVGYYSGTTGVLVADGTTERIKFTSGAATGFESAGDWDGIWFYDGTGNGTLLKNCLIAYGGGYSSNSGNLTIVNDKAGIPEISGCQIENSANWGIYIGGQASPTLTNNIFGNNASGDTNL